MRYRESLPSAALAPWVECYWSIQGPPATDRILPDGCADIIVDLGTNPHAFVAGTMSTALVTPSAGSPLFGIRFRPGAAFPFLGAPLRELTDQRVALDALWGGRAEPLIEAVMRGASVEQILRPPRVAWEDSIVPQAISLFRQARGGVAVRDVAAALGLGERRLNRAFDRCVGLSPKGFARVMRFREVYRRIQRGETIPWSRMAGDGGYADQPHLIREFQALAGLTPAQYLAERRSLAQPTLSPTDQSSGAVGRIDARRSRVRFVQYPENGER